MAYKNRNDFNAWRREQRRKRREHSLCVECGGDAVTGKRKCAVCLEKKNIGERIHKPRRRQERVAAGLCPECSKPTVAGKRYCETCLDRQGKKYRERRYVWCATCHRSTPNPPVLGKTMCQPCLDKAKERIRKQRKVVLDHYGCKCACTTCPNGCGVINPRHLTIDHKNNDGAKHRRETKGMAGNTYRWIIKNNFPDTFQVLCWNCNLAKEKYGGCT